MKTNKLLQMNTIKKKLYLIYVGLLFIPIILVGYYISIEIRSNQINTKIEEIEQNTIRTTNDLIRTFELLIRVSDWIYQDERLAQIIDTEYQNVYDVVQTYENYRQFSDYLKYYPEIDYLRFYTDNPTLLSSVGFHPVTPDIRSQAWYQDTVAKRGKIVWRMINDPITGHKNLNLTRSVFRNNQFIGVLTIAVSDDDIEQMLANSGNSTFLTLDNSLIFNHTSPESPEEVSDYNRLLLLEGDRIELDYTKKTPVTTNMMGAYKGLDYFKWAKEMDIVSWNSFPSYEPDWAHVSMMHDLMRGVKDGQSFMLMEQTPSQQNWQPYNSLKAPGRMRVQSYHTIAHGADSVQYFQLRRSKGGCEKFHGAVIEHVGHEDTRVFREVAQLGAELESLGDQLIGARSDSKVGILFDWDNYWAFEFTSGPNVDLYYVNQVQHYYNALYKKQVQVDMLHMDSDFSAYDVILAPVLYMVKEGVAERLEKFVANGGSFLTTFMSGIVDQSDNVHLGGYPGPLRNLLGLWVEEIDALAPNAANAITSACDAVQAADYKGSLVSDLIHLEGAQSLANYDSNWYAGMPAVTKHQFGKGTAYYIGTQADDDLTSQVVQLLLNEQNVAILENVPAGVEVTTRRKDGKEFVFIMNHKDTPASTDLAYEGYTDLLTGDTLSNDLELKAFDVKIAVKE